MLQFSVYGEGVQARIESSHGIRVVTRDIQDPLTGDLDGEEERLLLLGHLFGHTTQWNVHPDAFNIVRVRKPPVAEADLPAIIAYKRRGFPITRPAIWPVQVQARIESSHGIRVVTRDIQDPLTGDLDGEEERLLLLGHLFGHTVQWNVDLDAFERLICRRLSLTSGRRRLMRFRYFRRTAAVLKFSSGGDGPD